MTGEVVLEGMISVRAALISRNRDIHGIYIRRDKDRRETVFLERAAAAAGVSLERVDAGVIESIATGKHHGGVLALAGPRRYVDLPDLLATEAAPFIVMLDGVEDPYNFGAAIRSLYAAGAHGLIVPPRNWMSAAGTVARASAGASELIPTAVAASAGDAATFAGERGLVVACAAMHDAVTLYDADLTVPLFLLIGGERRGVTRSFLREAKLRLRIPYARPDAQSLGTAAAAAVIGFEVNRQRRGRKLASSQQ